MSLKMVKRIAADLTGAGVSRVKIKPGQVKRAKEALTRDDVRNLIEQDVIEIVKRKGVSRAIGRKRHAQRKKGRRRGKGSRKGEKYSNVKRKLIWMSKVRAQRRVLKELAQAGRIAEESYRRVYLMVKGRAFKSKSQLFSFLSDNGLLKKKE